MAAVIIFADTLLSFEVFEASALNRTIRLMPPEAIPLITQRYSVYVAAVLFSHTPVGQPDGCGWLAALWSTSARTAAGERTRYRSHY